MGFSLISKEEEMWKDAKEENTAGGCLPLPDLFACGRYQIPESPVTCLDKATLARTPLQLWRDRWQIESNC